MFSFVDSDFNPSKVKLIKPLLIQSNEKIPFQNYIGSKYQQVEWIEQQILKETGLMSLENVVISDLFCGSGVVSKYFKEKRAIVYANDIERFSSLITHAQISSDYNKKLKETINKYNHDLDKGKHRQYIDAITIRYSPYDGNNINIFTEENAQKIDYLRFKIHQDKDNYTLDEFIFLLASLIYSANLVSNIFSVYTSFFKQFQPKALKEFELMPIHRNFISGKVSDRVCKIYNKDALDIEFLSKLKTEIAYIDPPCDERQYYQSYFPLNVIATNPEEMKFVLDSSSLENKSSFCSNKTVLESFETLLEYIQAKWVFISYKEDGLVPREILEKTLSKYGRIKVIEKGIKQNFKKTETEIVEELRPQEYLFCIEKN